MEKTNWQRKDVTEHYLEEVRGGIPFGTEQVKIMLQIIEHFKPNPQNIIDLGCGNGFLAEVILRTYSNTKAILLDHSKPMIENARIHMQEYLDRCQIIHDDFSQSIQKYAKEESVDCIVSGFAIHHLSHEAKKVLFEEIYNTLAPGGVFINIEHVASKTTEIEKLYDELFINHLSIHNKKDQQIVAEEYYNRPDKEDNILAAVEEQVSWLREIGFNHADCYFKWLELAVFGGVK